MGHDVIKPSNFNNLSISPLRALVPMSRSMKSVRWLVVIVILGVSILRCSDGLLLQGESSLASGYPISFTFSNSYSVAAMAFYMGIEDVNGDNKVDLIISAGNWVYYRYNTTGAGTFGGALGVASAGSGNGRGIIVADLNGDGFRDLATAINGTGVVSINTNNAGSSFNAYAYSAVSAEPMDVATGDLDLDGDLDLVTTLTASNIFCVLAGNGAGAFAGCANSATGNGPFNISLKDFNGDGDLDVAVTNSGSGTVGIHLGSAGSTFSAPTTYPVGGSPKNVLAAHFNSDNYLDLLIGKSAGSTLIQLLKGNGDGSFQSATTVATMSTVSHNLDVGDFNGDGLTDFVASNGSDTSFKIYKNVGNGSFDSNPISFSTTCTTITAVKAKDLNGDGKLDIVLICSIPSNQMQVYLHD